MLADRNLRSNTSNVSEVTTHDFDYDLQDLADEANRDAVRALVFDLPARPGTRR